MTISTKDAPGPFDGFETAKPDEPIFTLQGGDPLAAPLVLLWAKDARRLGMSDELKPEKADAMLLRATEAERISWAMDAYREGREKQPEPQRAAYADTPPDAVAQAAQDRHAMLLHCARRLDNALAEANDIAELIVADGFAFEAADINAATAMLKRAADAVRPHRG